MLLQTLASVTVNVTLPTALWTLSAATGLGFSLTVLPQYVAKLKTAKRLSARNRKTAVALVRDYIASEANRTVQHALSLVVGIAAVFVPPAPPRDEPLPYALVVFGSLVILVLMTNNILATVNSVRAYVAWRRRYGVVVTAREEQQK